MTFWDAGEFITAAHSLGIPHPPGTPLFVLLLHTWAWVASRVMPYATATNLFSAVCTAAAGGLAAWLLARGATAAAAGAAAGAICAGAMSTVWMNATETEVYAAALLLAMATLAAAARSAREPGARWLILTAYLIALAVPLHLTALVAGPAAVVLAAQRPDGVDPGRGLLVAGAWVIAVGAGRVSPTVLGAGALVLAAGAVVERRRSGRRGSARGAAAVAAVCALGLSGVLFMLVRARFDPFLNQGNPSTWPALLDVLARRQYDVAGLWPRQAPAWLQLANVGQYADWQAALGRGETVLPSIGRTLGTAAFVALGFYGAARHRRDDRATWRALLTLLVCGTLGVATYVNFKAGPSLGAGILPASATHEARERDYFYFLGFWAWGLWAGYGAVALARRWRLPTAIGVLAAAAPIVLNWPAVTRRREPEAGLARRWATALLGATPRNAVLFAAGDNDTYPLWYAQEVLDVRRDVRVVTLPLMPAGWFRAELHRRGDLLPGGSGEDWLGGDASEASVVAARARAAGRPVAVSVYVDADTRWAIGDAWIDNGLVFVADTARPLQGAPPVLTADTTAARRLTGDLSGLAGPTRPAIDPADEYFQSLLRCPAYLVRRAAGRPVASLDSLCNFR